VASFPCLFGVYWLSVLAWSLMADRLCAGLRGRHPGLWAALDGRSREVALLGFVVRGGDLSLEDRPLARLCGAMRVLLAVYVLFFLAAPTVLLLG
jgi:hypothetical protein